MSQAPVSLANAQAGDTVILHSKARSDSEEIKSAVPLQLKTPNSCMVDGRVFGLNGQPRAELDEIVWVTAPEPGEIEAIREKFFEERAQQRALQEHLRQREDSAMRALVNYALGLRNPSTMREVLEWVNTGRTATDLCENLSIPVDLRKV